MDPTEIKFERIGWVSKSRNFIKGQVKKESKVLWFSYSDTTNSWHTLQKVRYLEGQIGPVLRVSIIVYWLMKRLWIGGSGCDCKPLSLEFIEFLLKKSHCQLFNNKQNCIEIIIKRKSHETSWLINRTHLNSLIENLFNFLIL